MRDEPAILLRIALFGLVSGVVYWFVAYEWLGFVALLTLGFGPGFAALAMYMADRHRGLPPESRRDTMRRIIGLPKADPPGPDDLSDDDLGVLPLPTIWPLGASLGMAILFTGLIFGAWLTLLGLGLAALSGWGWLTAINRETARGRLHREE